MKHWKVRVVRLEGRRDPRGDGRNTPAAALGGPLESDGGRARGGSERCVEGGDLILGWKGGRGGGGGGDIFFCFSFGFFFGFFSFPSFFSLSLSFFTLSPQPVLFSFILFFLFFFFFFLVQSIVLFLFFSSFL